MVKHLLIPDWPDLPGNIGALSTTRQGGVSMMPYDDGSGIGRGGMNLGVHVGDRSEAVQHNRALLRSSLPAEPTWLSQVHGTRVVDAAVASGAPEADASFTTVREVVCAVQSADCLPVLLCDSSGKMVGAAHAGWRGLVAGVLDNTVANMRDAGAGEMLAWLGPAIGPMHFEVGEDVRQAFVERFVDQGIDPDQARAAFRPVPGTTKYLADIYLLARSVLHRLGVTRISGGDLSTVSDAHRFYSYRRDRVTGRMASLIWIK
ncbi:peptidoglycan editing factor PgeF [Undibacterium arcticum]|uniref:Purine nucleoside phosphorylase n=1 Tax=Undibacterium arcticum TaxID=1762892 RepID=A0ABV7F483_9BURK